MTDPQDQPPADVQEALAQEFRAELEAEHLLRQQAQTERADRAQERREQRTSRAEAMNEAEIKKRVRTEFHKEKGYKLYTDSAGRQHWLTREEHEWRMAARARRDSRRKTFAPSFLVRQKSLMMYAGAVLLAVALGLFLVK